jgi:CO/xanthine dehydrogenase FAD-binding subunit
MIDFDYVKARDVSDAVSHIARDSAARFIAGGIGAGSYSL